MERQRLRAAVLALRLARSEVQAAESEISDGLASAILEHIDEIEVVLDADQQEQQRGLFDVRAGNVSPNNTLVPWGATL